MTPWHFLIEQYLKDNVHTAIPGHVVTYSATSRRAIVQPAIRLAYTDGTEVSKPPVGNVPVLFPSGGGYTVHLPLEKGDPVMLLCSERSMADFKRAYQEASPGTSPLFSMRDAVAIPGFGPSDGDRFSQVNRELPSRPTTEIMV